MKVLCNLLLPGYRFSSAVGEFGRARLARTEVESQKSVLIINTDGIHEWAEIEDECVQVESC